MRKRDRLEKSRKKKAKIVIGLISGTSADGVSAVITKILGSGINTKVEIQGFETYSYHTSLKDMIFKLFYPETSTVDLICHMNFVLGETFAEAALSLIDKYNISHEEVDLIGSHGQTIHHLPKIKKIHTYKVRSTLQIGEPAIIAERTGIPTVADFRKADIAAGGQGAPLTPYLDFILHRNHHHSRILQNIGGIANLTYLPSGCSVEDIIAFDTGPGNMVIDALVRKYTKNAKMFDEDGRIASQGKIDYDLLDELLKHPFFLQEPPKTTGREEFGETYALNLLQKVINKGGSFEDAIATATALTVQTITNSYKKYLPKDALYEVFLSGGGAKNNFLVESLVAEIDPTPLKFSGDIGVPEESKEAVLMAVLANEHLNGNSTNIPKATGAKKAVILGALYPAS